MRVRVCAAELIPQIARRPSPHAGNALRRGKEIRKTISALQSGRDVVLVAGVSTATMSSANSNPRAALPVRPFTLVALVLLSAFTCGVSVWLALAPTALGFSSAQVSHLQWLNLALSSITLALAIGAAWTACRRRVRELEGLITICAWTQRVRWQGHWISFEDYLAQRFNLRCTHGICEEAAEIMKRDALRNPIIAELRRNRSR